MSNSTGERTLSQLFGDSFAELAKLIQNEVDLARAELRDKVAIGGGAIALIAAGAVLLIPAVVLLLCAIATWLITLGLAAPLAYFGTALSAGVIAFALLWTGVGRITNGAMKPTVTIGELERDKNLAKELIQ